MKSPKVQVKDDVNIEVKTGNKCGAGTDGKVWLILYDEVGRTSLPIRLSNRLINNSRNQSSFFQVKSKMSDLRQITMIEFWLEKFGLGEAWYVEYLKISVLGENYGAPIVFPVHRWIRPQSEHFLLIPYDSYLPQNSLEKLNLQRKTELRERRQNYRYKQYIENGPMQVIIKCIKFFNKFEFFFDSNFLTNFDSNYIEFKISFRFEFESTAMESIDINNVLNCLINYYLFSCLKLLNLILGGIGYDRNGSTSIRATKLVLPLYEREFVL